MRIREIVLEDRAQIELMLAIEFGMTIDSLVEKSSSTNASDLSVLDKISAFRDINNSLVRMLRSDIWNNHMKYDVDRLDLYKLATHTICQNDDVINALYRRL